MRNNRSKNNIYLFIVAESGFRYVRGPSPSEKQQFHSSFPSFNYKTTFLLIHSSFFTFPFSTFHSGKLSSNNFFFRIASNPWQQMINSCLAIFKMCNVMDLVFVCSEIRKWNNDFCFEIRFLKLWKMFDFSSLGMHRGFQKINKRSSLWLHVVCLCSDQSWLMILSAAQIRKWQKPRIFNLSYVIMELEWSRQVLNTN